MSNVAAPTGQAEYLPLYAQVKALLVKRIGTGGWKPGQMLPSEYELAAEYNVSQGTVRKALIALENDRMIVRRQGVGTFVARHSRDRSLYQFFRMVGLDDARLIPTSVVLSQKEQPASREHAQLLSVKTGALLHSIVRIRSLLDKPAIYERIFVPVDVMPNLVVETHSEMDDEMYVIYQETFGISIFRVNERLSAASATAEEAKRLDIKAGTPLLEISRVAVDVGGRPVELRVSRCDTRRCRYAAEVF